jgi:hypothetical protein
MLHRSRLVALLTLAAACTDYQFRPAGHCLLLPGAAHVRLDDTSSVDILFVVDDSPSMDPKQQGLANSFRDFVGRMVEINTGRASKGLLPIDFHIAVTTSSVFATSPTSASCVTAGGATQCCQTSACQDVASCTRGTAGGCAGGQVCVVRPTLDANGTVTGERDQCCTPSSCTASAGCALGDACPALTTTYPDPFPSSSYCTPGLAVAGAPYTAGALVSAGSNPKVLDFPKDLGWASWGTTSPDPALGSLVTQFTQNIRVGSCGSGEEQHLEAARIAIEKAAGIGWPKPGAKLVIVWVGDEDDCSSPASAPLVMATHTPGADSCVWDKHRPPGDQREIPVSAYADFFSSLAHPGGASSFGAAFIVSPSTGACAGAYAGGERFYALADQLKARGVEVVEGSVCDAYPPASFGPVLQQIADILPPPNVLSLPSQPATAALTSLTIADASGITRRTCTQGADWCFVADAACNDKSATPACLAGGTSQCIGINHTTGSCEANPGETYSAEYLGLLPAGGCATVSDCTAVLGGAAKDWACTIEPGASRGTCTCNGGK